MVSQDDLFALLEAGEVAEKAMTSTPCRVCKGIGMRGADRCQGCMGTGDNFLDCTDALTKLRSLGFGVKP